MMLSQVHKDPVLCGACGKSAPDQYGINTYPTQCERCKLIMYICRDCMVDNSGYARRMGLPTTKIDCFTCRRDDKIEEVLK